MIVYHKVVAVMPISEGQNTRLVLLADHMGKTGCLLVGAPYISICKHPNSEKINIKSIPQYENIAIQSKITCHKSVGQDPAL